MSQPPATDSHTVRTHHAHHAHHSPHEAQQHHHDVPSTVIFSETFVNQPPPAALLNPRLMPMRRAPEEQAKRDRQALVLRKVNELFVQPFIQGMVSGAGHYLMRMLMRRMFQDKSYDPLT